MKIMVALNETTSEPGPRPTARACRVTTGPDQGKSFGYASWGQTFYWGFWTAGGNPAGVRVTRWVEGMRIAGNAAQKRVAVDRVGLSPLPGGVSW